MNALIIANTQIRRDAAGRYCLNDLHQASGGEKRHQPSDWLRLKQTQELIAEVASSPESPDQLRESPELNPIETTEGRYGGGTYAVKELVYAYAMWISAKFHLHVIRAYDALVTQRVSATATDPPPVPLAATHRADVLVSAGRIFSAALRVAHRTRMAPARAMRAAFACAHRHTGIDWSDELGVDPGTDEASADAAVAYDDSPSRFYAALIGGHIPGVVPRPSLSTDVYTLYCLWCTATGNQPTPQQHLINALQRRHGVVNARKRYQAGAQVLGPHGVLYLGVAEPQGDASETVWLGEQIRAFHAAVLDYREAST